MHPVTTGEKKIAAAWERALIPVLSQGVPIVVTTVPITPTPIVVPTTQPTVIATVPTIEPDGGPDDTPGDRDADSPVTFWCPGLPDRGDGSPDALRQLRIDPDRDGEAPHLHRQAPRPR